MSSFLKSTLISARTPLSDVSFTFVILTVNVAGSVPLTSNVRVLPEFTAMSRSSDIDSLAVAYGYFNLGFLVYNRVFRNTLLYYLIFFILVA